MIDGGEWTFGVKNGSEATIYGSSYSRIATSTDVPDNVDTVFLTIGRTPFGFVAGGYVAPREDEE